MEVAVKAKIHSLELINWGMILHIKNMVCRRCIETIRTVFSKLEIPTGEITLGKAVIHADTFPGEVKEKLDCELRSHGFEIIDDKNSILIEAVKTIIIDKIQNGDLAEPSIIWSDFIARSIHYDYRYVSRLFSSMNGITIEQFIILQKIEKVKELIVYDELSLSEIAWKLGYSSVAHLSGQFKKVTGMSPRKFKKIGGKGRKQLDKV